MNDIDPIIALINQHLPDVEAGRVKMSIERYKQGAAAVVLEKDGVRTRYAFQTDANGQTTMLVEREKIED